MRKALFCATEKIPGLWACMVCRKRSIDDRLDATVARTAVVLDAGFDARGCGGGSGRVFEVDLPANVNAWHDRLRTTFGELPSWLADPVCLLVLLVCPGRS